MLFIIIGGKGAAGGQSIASVLQLGRCAGADREAQRRTLAGDAQGHQPSDVSQGPRGERLLSPDVWAPVSVEVCTRGCRRRHVSTIGAVDRRRES